MISTATAATTTTTTPTTTTKTITTTTINGSKTIARYGQCTKNLIVQKMSAKKIKMSKN